MTGDWWLLGRMSPSRIAFAYQVSAILSRTFVSEGSLICIDLPPAFDSSFDILSFRIIAFFVPPVHTCI